MKTYQKNSRFKEPKNESVIEETNNGNLKTGMRSNE